MTTINKAIKSIVYLNSGHVSYNIKYFPYLIMMNTMTGVDLYNLNILQKGRIMTDNVRIDLNSNKTKRHTKSITLLKNIFF